MQKNGRFVLLIGLGIALALGIGYWLSDAGDPHDDGPARLADGRRARASHDSIGFGAGDRDRDPSERGRRGRALAGDGGVAPVRPHVRSGRTAPPIVDMPRSADADGHSAGWRLGQTRHHIAIVEPRIAHMEQLIRDFEARGDTAAAEQQRTILQRFQNRLNELHADETELEAEARRDGTLGEVDRGYDEGADERQRARAPAIQTPAGGGSTPGHESSATHVEGSDPAAARPLGE